MKELDKILEGLIQRTVDGRLKWSSTLSDHFIVSIDAISVVIRKSLSGGHHLEIFGESGETIEVLDRPHATDEQNRQLDLLYRTARRSALNTQATLEKLAKALDL